MNTSPTDHLSQVIKGIPAWQPKKKNAPDLKPGAQGAGAGLPLGVTDAQESDRRVA